jgi:isopentenyldiphosphate isomerase
MKMIIQIVDENDNLIGHKDSKNLDKDDIYRITALWIKNSKGENLLARRAYSKRLDPGVWGPAAAGTLEKGETYDSNIIKEAEEEIGLKNFKFEKSKKVIRKRRKRNYFCQWYKAVIDKEISEFKIDKNEVHEVKWFTREEILQGLKNNPEEFLPTLKYYEEWF